MFVKKKVYLHNLYIYLISMYLGSLKNKSMYLGSHVAPNSSGGCVSGKSGGIEDRS